MAKFIVTSGTTFDPFTYDELAKPVMQTVEAHNAAQDAYDSLAMDTEALRQYLATEPEDSPARAMYNAYTAKLANLQNNLWQNGYNAGTRRDLAAARAGYASDITRLATAISDRKADSKAHREAKIKNPDLVTSADPILRSISSYLDNTAGQDYFSYSGKEFEAGVATEIQAKAQGLLSSRVIKDPSLVDQLTRITNYGVTEAERQEASRVVDSLLNESKENRDAYYKNNNTSVPVQLLVETLIGRYDAIGARGADIDDNERGRLINYGKAGWAHATFKPEQKDFKDAVYEEQAAFRQMEKQHELNKALEKYKNDIKNPQPDPNAPYTMSNITRSYEVPGKDHEKKEKTVNKRIDMDVPTKLISKNGREVTNHADASSLVYSEELRRKMYPYLGFDIGRDPTRGIAGVDALTPSSRYLEGKIVDENGKEAYTRFEPYTEITDPETGKVYKGVVVGRRTPDEAYRVDLKRTRAYHEARKKYEERLDYYNKNEKDIAKMATIDPDTQYDYYKEDELDFGEVPLEGYKAAVMSRDDNRMKTIRDTYIAENGTDSGKYIGRLSGKLSNKFTVTESGPKKGTYTGEFTLDGVPYNGRKHDGNMSGFHMINKNGDVTPEAIRNLNDVFTFDKDGNISNIRSYYVNIDAIANGYLIVETSKSKNPVTIPIEYFGDDALTDIFRRRQQEWMMVMSDRNLDDESKIMASLIIQDKLCTQIKNTVGYMENTQSESGTNKDDTN